MSDASQKKTTSLDSSSLRPKPLGKLAFPSTPPELTPARMINEVLYCERLMYLEWAQGEFADNVFTVEGRAVHRRADRPDMPLKAPVKAKSGRGKRAKAVEIESEEATDADKAIDDEAIAAQARETRSVWLSSERLKMTARIDIVEEKEGRVAPIEYKRGKRPDLPEGAYLPERAQLCAQVLLLREHGFECREAYLYYAGDRRRTPISIDEALCEQTLKAAQRAQELTAEGALPPPLVDSPKCDGCSLVGICLPDEVNLLYARQKELYPEGFSRQRVEVEPSSIDFTEDLLGPLDEDPWDLAGDGGLPKAQAERASESVLRRLHPARDDQLPLYVSHQGARIGLDGERLRIEHKREPLGESRLPNTSQVNIFGNVQVSTQAVKALLERGIILSYFSYGGWYLGRAVGHDSKNVELRLAQYRGATSPELCVRLARTWIHSKVRNCRTLLRRNHDQLDPTVLPQLKDLARKALKAPTLEHLLGIEGSAARVYFGAFGGIFKDGGSATAEGFDLNGRNRRPPKDPVNALLSFTYALLTKDVALAVQRVGLDSLLGFYHQPRFGRPALALDLMEEFRPIIADSVVVTVINNGTVRQGDFLAGATGVTIKPAARKRLIAAYERRMDHLVTHPVFGYRISYRRVLEVQGRLLGRLLLGEIDRYPSFQTR